MTGYVRNSLVGLLLAGVAGCSGAVGPSQTGSGAGTGTATAGTAGATGTPGAANTNGTTGTEVTCVPGIPATSQIPRMTRLQYDTVVKDLLGVTGLMSNGNRPPSALLAEDSTGSVTDIAWTGYLGAAQEIAAEVMAGSNKAKFISCDPAAAGTAGTTCLTNTITTFGRKAFRRPLTAAEVTSFQRFSSLTPAGTPAQVAEAILFAFLASPSFISLPELGQTMEGTAYKLSSYEVATRLSFLLWNSVPDDALNSAADMGLLTTADQIGAQAQRMLQSPKAAAVASTFHRAYAAIEPNSHWTNNTAHNGTKFPAFTAGSYAAAMAELDAFFQDLVVGGGTFADLFTSSAGFVTKDTAPLYGLTSTATTPTKVALDATKRPGFLTRIGFLSTFAHDDTSSPILRGAFITGRVLNIPTGTPDPSFLGMTAPPGNYTTNRQAVEALTGGSPCNTCHTTKVNPPGFVLERFNAVGTWQDKDSLGGDIDSSADVILSVSPAVTKKLTTPAELMAAIAQQPNAQRNYAQQWVGFATARSPNANDACLVDQLAGGLAKPTYTIASMMADYTQANSFRLRTLGN